MELATQLAKLPSHLVSGSNTKPEVLHDKRQLARGNLNYRSGTIPLKSRISASRSSAGHAGITSSPDIYPYNRLESGPVTIFSGDPGDTGGRLLTLSRLV